MSDEMTRSDGATLACAAAVTPERLSSWRDGLLLTSEAEWLAAHTAGCAACGERLRDYDQIGAALRGQVIPASGADPWPAMRQRIADERRGVRVRLPQTPAWGWLGAVVAATLLVALFAGLLAHQATLRIWSGPSQTTAATPPGVWTEVAAYRGVAGLHVAPSDPRVAYQIWLDTQNGAGTTLTLRRTDDEGATWHTLTPPAIPGGAHPTAGGPVIGFVSPLDARVVYLIIDAQTNAGCATSAAAPSGQCQLEFVSVNGGDTWQPLILPTPGLISGLLVGQGDQAGQIAGDLRAQGSRLYATVVRSQLGQEAPPAPGRLVVSDDGGVTWRLIDAPIFATGQGIYDYAPTPIGSTIYVISEPVNQPAGPVHSPPLLTIWGSNDVGATWKSLGPTPDGAMGAQTVMSMRAAMAVSNRSPYLYFQTADYDGKQYIQRSGLDASHASLGAPGLTGTGASVNGATILTTLSDGSVVVAYAGVVEAWLESYTGGGNAAWRPLTRQEDLSTISDAITQRLPNGSVRLWLIGTTSQGVAVEYATLKQ